MQVAYVVISIIIVIVSVLLTLVVLVQNSKGGGLAANFAAGNQTFGVRQTADILEKVTWILAGTVLVLCVVATFLTPGKYAKTSKVQERIEQNVPVEGQPSLPANTFNTESETPAE
ncbi:MAG: preprotein translocase subunit SecG [Bacteroidales bacterium]|nr:preprotein translocase subunit SecG [Bacteroidales bacterium]